MTSFVIDLEETTEQEKHAVTTILFYENDFKNPLTGKWIATDVLHIRVDVGTQMFTCSFNPLVEESQIPVISKKNEVDNFVDSIRAAIYERSKKVDYEAIQNALWLLGEEGTSLSNLKSYLMQAGYAWKGTQLDNKIQGLIRLGAIESTTKMTTLVKLKPKEAIKKQGSFRATATMPIQSRWFVSSPETPDTCTYAISLSRNKAKYMFSKQHGVSYKSVRITKVD